MKNHIFIYFEQQTNKKKQKVILSTSDPGKFHCQFVDREHLISISIFYSLPSRENNIIIKCWEDDNDDGKQNS